MLYQSLLREVQQQNIQPQPEIQESLKGVDFDYFFTGKREGTGGAIELHITSIVTDWATNTYSRQSIYRGHKEKWKECIKKHIIYHLQSLNVDAGIIRSMMRYFEVDEEKYRSWERYFSKK
ncbi:hypothetical protein [Salinimicrobium oceani]|uniref:Uncharacterized protein n=1 Tax=Salinimicrobium oceani TaxID=2722702 RepID=A0ABX1CWR3_9FLAO|nr:hypothetical protein [Salinimicrobium oceani]NJW51794.1 hypothetical protein [Salinimicrobium oceani]